MNPSDSIQSHQSVYVNWRAALADGLVEGKELERIRDFALKSDGGIDGKEMNDMRAIVLESSAVVRNYPELEKPKQNLQWAIALRTAFEKGPRARRKKPYTGDPPAPAPDDGPIQSSLILSLSKPQTGVYDSIFDLLKRAGLSAGERIPRARSDELSSDELPIPPSIEDSLPSHAREIYRMDPKLVYPPFENEVFGGPNCYNAVLHFNDPSLPVAPMSDGGMIQHLEQDYEAADSLETGDVIMVWQYYPKSEQPWHVPHVAAFLKDGFVFTKRDHSRWSKHTITTIMRTFAPYDAELNNRLLPEGPHVYENPNSVNRYLVLRRKLSSVARISSPTASEFAPSKFPFPKN